MNFFLLTDLRHLIWAKANHIIIKIPRPEGRGNRVVAILIIKNKFNTCFSSLLKLHICSEEFLILSSIKT